MSWLKTNNLAGLKNRVWSVALLALATTISAAPQSSAQAMQKGISVDLARTSSAVPVPDADNQDALIVTVTDSGGLYFGIDPVTPKCWRKSSRLLRLIARRLFISRRTPGRLTRAS